MKSRHLQVFATFAPVKSTQFLCHLLRAVYFAMMWCDWNLLDVSASNGWQLKWSPPMVSWSCGSQGQLLRRVPRPGSCTLTVAFIRTASPIAYIGCIPGPESWCPPSLWYSWLVYMVHFCFFSVRTRINLLLCFLYLLPVFLHSDTQLSTSFSYVSSQYLTYYIGETGVSMEADIQLGWMRWDAHMS